MAAFTAIALGLGLAASVAGTIITASAQSKMADAQRDASVRAENARRSQMQLDADRRRREAVRQAQQARAAALTAGTSQGAAMGSGVAGGMAQATATGFQNQQTTNSGLFLGNQISDANIDYANATAAGQKGMAFGGALSSLGGVLSSNAGTFGRLGTYYTQRI